MLSSRFRLLSIFGPLVAAWGTHAARPSYIGCFYDSGGLIDYGPRVFQSRGLCFTTCNRVGRWVSGLTNGTNCLCGNSIPPLNSRVDETECNLRCPGYAQDRCGGRGPVSVWIREPDVTEETQVQATAMIVSQ